MASLRTALRPPLSAAIWPAIRPFRGRVERSRQGGRLSPGIAAVVAAKDEQYTVGLCLRSLVGFADQIVCLDNGSQDRTLAEIEAFADTHGHLVDLDVVSMPDAQLVDLWEQGLNRTRYQWHIRWDADRIAQTSGPDSIMALRERVLGDPRPRSVQLPLINLFGDLLHTLRLDSVLGQGEPYLMRFGRGIRYREIGRFPVAKIPLYYQQRLEPRAHLFHLGGLKSDENLMHRFHYFEWRETVNREQATLDPELSTIEGFKRRRNLELFGTTDPRSLKFRYQRQLSYHLVPYDPERYGDYPETLQAELARERPRFEVLYRDGRPWRRVDHEDEEMRDYEPTAEDLAWDPEAFLRRVLSERQLRALGVTPAPPPGA